MNKEELQKMADEHFAANPKETKCYATSDGNVWMEKDKAFAQRHADSLKETAMEFIRMEKPLAPEVKKEAPKKANSDSETKTDESENEETKTDESEKEETKTDESEKAVAPKVETPKAAPKKAAPVKKGKK